MKFLHPILLSLLLVTPLAPSHAKCSKLFGALVNLFKPKENKAIEHFYSLSIGPEFDNTVKIIERGSTDTEVTTLTKIPWHSDNVFLYEFFAKLQLTLQNNQWQMAKGTLSYSSQDLSTRVPKKIIDLELNPQQVTILPSIDSGDFQITIDRPIFSDTIINHLREHLAKISPSLFAGDYLPQITTILRYQNDALTPVSLVIDIPGKVGKYHGMIYLPIEMLKFSAQ